MTATFHCTCSENSGHSDPRQCSTARFVTKADMGRADAQAGREFVARGDKLRAAHDTHLVNHHGCPACPAFGHYVRDSVAGPWYVPAKN